MAREQPRGEGRDRRACEVCGAIAPRLLTRARFVRPGTTAVWGYRVVACRTCGFVYADDIPVQTAMNRDYAASGKYTYNRRIPRGIAELHATTVDAIDQFASRRFPGVPRAELRIIDVGCSTGYMLHLLRERGYARVQGIEPSRQCCALGRRQYGLRIFQGVVADFPRRQHFDLIISSSVLEHIRDVRQSVLDMVTLLDQRGAICIVVPHAGRFSLRPQSPFDEFSLEHINFFTRGSLANLMTHAGLREVESHALPVSFHDSTALLSFFSRPGGRLARDGVGERRILRYSEASRARLARLDRQLRGLRDRKQPVVVWGAGALTARLLATSVLGRLSIAAFIDSNHDLWGKRLAGATIVAPAQIRHHLDAVVFVASYQYRDEITGQLRGEFGFRGRILSL